MVKKKEGFTLIELLAVLVILSVIALIITPIVTGLIKDANIKAAENSANGLISAVEVYYDREVLKNDGVFNNNKTAVIEFDGEEGGNSTGTVDGDVAIEFNGYTVTSGTIYVERDGNITVDLANPITINNHKCVSDTSNASCVEDKDYVINTLLTPEVNASPTQTWLGTDIVKNTVESVRFVKTNVVPKDSIKSYDVSALKNGSVMLWYYDSDGNGRYEVTIGQEGGVIFNAYSNHLFRQLSNLKSVDLSNTNASLLKDMSFWFYQCSSLESINFTGFKPSNLTSLWGTFWGCSKLTSLDVSSFNTSNVTDMRYVFAQCSGIKNLDVSNFNTSNVTDMTWMFANMSSLESIDISSFDTSNVTAMASMFTGCSKLKSLDVSHFYTPKLGNMASMFQGCSSLEVLDLTGFNTSKVLFMANIVRDCSSLKTVYASELWSTAKVTNGKDSFTGATNISGAITYDGSKTDYSYANYTNGYFTYKARN